MNNYLLESVDQYPEHVILNLKPKSTNDIINFIPGQYVSVGFKIGSKLSPMRCFSIASAPESTTLQLAMRPTGLFTRKISKLQSGTEMQLQGPFGEFNIPSSVSNVVMIAAGVGITPFMSMLRQMAAKGTDKNIYLIYASRRNEDIPFYKEIKKITSSNQKINVLHMVFKGTSSPADNIYVGMVNEELLDKLNQKDYSNRHFMLCGPPKFMNSITKILQKNGVKENDIQSEAFQQGSLLETGITYKSALNTYALSAFVFMLGIGAVALKDVNHYLEKISGKQNNQSTQTNPVQTNNDNTNFQRRDDNAAPEDNNSSQYYNTSTTTNSTQNNQTYQSPRTQVS